MEKNDKKDILINEEAKLKKEDEKKDNKNIPQEQGKMKIDMSFLNKKKERIEDEEKKDEQKTKIEIEVKVSDQQPSQEIKTNTISLFNKSNNGDTNSTQTKSIFISNSPQLINNVSEKPLFGNSENTKSIFGAFNQNVLHTESKGLVPSVFGDLEKNENKTSLFGTLGGKNEGQFFFTKPAENIPINNETQIGNTNPKEVKSLFGSTTSVFQINNQEKPSIFSSNDTNLNNAFSFSKQNNDKPSIPENNQPSSIFSTSSQSLFTGNVNQKKEDNSFPNSVPTQPAGEEKKISLFSNLTSKETSKEDKPVISNSHSIEEKKVEAKPETKQETKPEIKLPISLQQKEPTKIEKIGKSPSPNNNNIEMKKETKPIVLIPIESKPPESKPLPQVPPQEEQKKNTSKSVSPIRPIPQEEKKTSPQIQANQQKQNITKNDQKNKPILSTGTPMMGNQPISLPEIPAPTKKVISFAEAKKEIEDFAVQLEKMEGDIQKKYSITFPDMSYEDVLPDEMKIKIIEEYFDSKEIKELLSAISK